MSSSSFAKGKEGELRAEHFLRGHGFQVLTRNFYTQFGEIDLVIERSTSLRFVEVKAYKNIDVYSLERVIGPQKRRRLAQVAQQYLSLNPRFLNYSIQFDLVFIDKTTNDVFWYEDVIQHEN